MDNNSIFSQLVTWSLVLIPMMYSPGATNILVASTGAKFGLKNSLSLIGGINVGITLQLLVVSLGAAQFFVAFPMVFTSLHYLGMLYMFYLAYIFYKAESQGSATTETNQHSFIDGVLVELLNPKVWLSLIIIYAAFLNDPRDALHHAILFSLLTIALNIINNILWSLSGFYLLRKLFTGKFAKIQNYFYGSLMALVGVWMLVEHFYNK